MYVHVGMSARQTIAMMAAHGISTHAHNKIIGVHYRLGNPQAFPYIIFTVSDGLELRSYPTCTSKPWEADLSTTLAWDLPSSHSGERRVSYWVDLNFICFFFPLICPCILCPAPGDKFGRPLNRDIQGDFTLHTNNW